MRIERIGFTPLKGSRHARHDSVELTPTGPVGDRVFALVDPAKGRLLRTVENPRLLPARSRWADGVLSVELAGVVLEAVPAPTGEQLKVDYWGHVAVVEVVEGPWAAAYSRLLGHDVVLTRSMYPGEVVYGAPVTLVSTSSMTELGSRLGQPVDSARFRSTFLVYTDGNEPHIEDSWVGRELRVGGATLAVHSRVPRCTVIDLDPETGDRDLGVLKELARYRRVDNEIWFAVDATVTGPGRVRDGDPVSLVTTGSASRRS